MLVTFAIDDEPRFHMERDLLTLPTVGTVIAWHTDKMSEVFEVERVTMAFEDREAYQGKSYGGDRVWVSLKRKPKPEFDLDAFMRSRTV